MRTTKPHAYVLDTTVLIEDPDVLYRLSGQIFIPTAVIKQIDGLKRGDGNTARAAREVARTLDLLGSYEDYSAESLADGVRLSSGGILIVYPFYDAIDDLDSEADNRIVGAAMRLKREGVPDVLLLTTDKNMKTIARAHRVKASFYPYEMVATKDDSASRATIQLSIAHSCVGAVTPKTSRTNSRQRRNITHAHDMGVYRNVFVRFAQRVMSIISADGH